ncbi:hypothetical protein MVEN_00825200 [Mycena venus]|uniref:Uncharacterized protein n=1 Tax=Mycena venus TaxID=2733690 RepID=A0A8H7D390_9AGAR|nr:hypothetical protein MVEN_00825200 [Mycena venus]
MYFHNAATHRMPRAQPAINPHWVPFFLSAVFPRTPTNRRDRYFDLYLGSEALPRASKPQSGAVHFQLPSGGEDSATTYVLSWPPALPAATVSPPSSAFPNSSCASVYYTPPTSPTGTPANTPTSLSGTSAVSTPSTDHSSLDTPQEPTIDVIDLTGDEDRLVSLTKAQVHAKPSPRRLREPKPKGVGPPPRQRTACTADHEKHGL